MFINNGCSDFAKDIGLYQFTPHEGQLESPYQAPPVYVFGGGPQNHIDSLARESMYSFAPHEGRLESPCQPPLVYVFGKEPQNYIYSSGEACASVDHFLYWGVGAELQRKSEEALTKLACATIAQGSADYLQDAARTVLSIGTSQDPLEALMLEEEPLRRLRKRGFTEVAQPVDQMKRAEGAAHMRLQSAWNTFALKSKALSEDQRLQVFQAAEAAAHKKVKTFFENQMDQALQGAQAHADVLGADGLYHWVNKG